MLLKAYPLVMDKGLPEGSREGVDVFVIERDDAFLDEGAGVLLEF
jgi:hypothetical protein